MAQQAKSDILYLESIIFGTIYRHNNMPLKVVRLNRKMGLKYHSN